jgi:S1-C subfamily serine protease
VEPLFGRPSLRAERPRDGTSIAVSGYPLGESVLVTNHGTVASAWGLELDKRPDPATPSVTSRDVYLGDLQSNPGNSGGPVYATEDGAVIGVLVAGRLTAVDAGGAPAVIDGVALQADAGLSLIVPARYVCEMLDRHGVAYQSA